MPSPKRAVVAHAQLPDAADFPRFAQLGVVGSVQPEHAMGDRDVADAIGLGALGAPSPSAGCSQPEQPCVDAVRSSEGRRQRCPLRWGEARALRVDALAEIPFAQLVATRSHSDRYEEKETKTWRGTRTLPLSPRALEIFRLHSSDKPPDEYLFTNQVGKQLSVGVVNKFPLGFERHSLRHFAASTWLRLGTPIHEVAEYLGDDSRTALAVYAHILGEGQRRAHAQRLALAETQNQAGDTWGTPGAKSAAKPAVSLLKAEHGN